MELKDTVKGMTSDDYKERFVAEYHQTKIRYEKLKALNNRIEAQRFMPFEKKKQLDFKIDCCPDLLEQQQRVMGEYLHLLEVRAVVEGIEL